MHVSRENPEPVVFIDVMFTDADGCLAQNPVILEVLGLEEVSLWKRRFLLVERGPSVSLSFNSLELLTIRREALGPKGLSLFAAKGVFNFAISDSGEDDLLPTLGLFALFDEFLLFFSKRPTRSSSCQRVIMTMTAPPGSSLE